jgi:Fe-S cluster biogenesis protein NfuA
MLIQVEETPNPNALKFIPNAIVSPIKPLYFVSIEEAVVKSKLAVELLSIDNVKSVFLGDEFITVTKDLEADWLIMKPSILTIISDYIVHGKDIIEIGENKLELTQDYSEIEKQIIEIIETRVRPSVAMDGGDIIYRSFENGIVKLELRGACSGCPSSTITLKRGIESMLKHFVPEVQSVEAVDE